MTSIRAAEFDTIGQHADRSIQPITQREATRSARLTASYAIRGKGSRRAKPGALEQVQRDQDQNTGREDNSDIIGMQWPKVKQLPRGR